MFAKITELNEQFQVEKRLVRKDGGIVWVNESITAIVNEQQKAESTIGILFDVTYRKELEQHKDEFIGIASHELKTPLTSILAYAQLLEQRLVASDINGSIDLVQKLNRQIDRMNNLVNDLLDTTRVAENRLVLDKESIDLNELVADRLEDFRQLSSKHRVDFKAGAIGTVIADKVRIEEVMSNLVANAIKYSAGGKVFISTEEVNNGVKVAVADEGIGIPPDSLSQVFDRFFRADRDNHGFGGLGLGLYISAGIIRSHQGQIGVQSQVGKGSVFYFILPYLTDSSV